MLLWFSGLPSQKWVWPSTTKISLPSGVLNISLSLTFGYLRRAAERAARPLRAATGLDVLEHFFHVAEQNEGVVVDADHASVMRRSVDLEVRGRHLAAEKFGDFIHLEDQLALAVDADERRLVGDGDAGLLAHQLGDCARLDRVVHGDAALVRERILEFDVLHRLEDVVVMRLRRLRCGCGHCSVLLYCFIYCLRPSSLRI